MVQLHDQQAVHLDHRRQGHGVAAHDERARRGVPAVARKEVLRAELDVDRRAWRRARVRDVDRVPDERERVVEGEVAQALDERALRLNGNRLVPGHVLVSDLAGSAVHRSARVSHNGHCRRDVVVQLASDCSLVALACVRAPDVLKELDREVHIPARRVEEDAQLPPVGDEHRVHHFRERGQGRMLASARMRCDPRVEVGDAFVAFAVVHRVRW